MLEGNGPYGSGVARSLVAATAAPSSKGVIRTAASSRPTARNEEHRLKQLDA